MATISELIANFGAQKDQLVSAFVDNKDVKSLFGVDIEGVTIKLSSAPQKTISSERPIGENIQSAVQTIEGKSYIALSDLADAITNSSNGIVKYTTTLKDIIEESKTAADQHIKEGVTLPKSAADMAQLVNAVYTQGTNDGGASIQREANKQYEESAGLKSFEVTPSSGYDAMNKVTVALKDYAGPTYKILTTDLSKSTVTVNAADNHYMTSVVVDMENIVVALAEI